jgi:Response regulator containing CheY-like receiver and SARP domains
MDAPLRIALFGALTVQIGDRTLPDSVWRSRQEQRLLAILAATRGRVIAAGRLCEWLWPDSDSASASVNLRSAISNLRRVLEPEADRASRRYILTRSGGYAWNRESGAWIDVDEFLTLTESLAGGQTTGSMEQGEADLERAITLYRGDFLEDEQELAWAAMERERLRARYLDALRRVAEIKLDRGDPMAAAALASRGIAIAPLAEPLWRILMLAQARSGDTAGALQSYERYRHLLDHELGAAPSPQTQALHMAILRGDPGSYALLRSPHRTKTVMIDSGSNRAVHVPDNVLRDRQQRRLLDVRRNWRYYTAGSPILIGVAVELSPSSVKRGSGRHA